ncbi:Proprotein convertase subtilisin/kexin type 9 [Savitreella phatthalungensis]
MADVRFHSAHTDGIMVWTTASRSLLSLLHPSTQIQQRAIPYSVINGVWLPSLEGLEGLIATRGVLLATNDKVEFDEGKVVARRATWPLERISRGPVTNEREKNRDLTYVYEYFPTLQGQDTLLWSLDTGARIKHREFLTEEEAEASNSNERGRPVAGRVQTPTELAFIPDKPRTRQLSSDLYGHGTAVLSCALGRTVGVARRAQAYAVRISQDDTLGATVDSVLRGLGGIVENFQHVPPRLRHTPIILFPAHHAPHQGRPPSEILRHAWHVMMAHHSAIVVSGAGNTEGDTCTYTPGGVTGVVNVGSMHAYDGGTYAYSNGACVTLNAPGVRIKVASVRESFSTRYGTGTSFAAAFVAGVLLTAMSSGSPLRDALISSERASAWLTATAWHDVLNHLPPNTPNLLLRSMRTDAGVTPADPAQQ